MVHVWDIRDHKKISALPVYEAIEGTCGALVDAKQLSERLPANIVVALYYCFHCKSPSVLGPSLFPVDIGKLP
jgi:hypothetical protein